MTHSLKFFRRLLLEIDAKLSGGWLIHGIPVHNLSNRVTVEAARAALEEAFRILEAYDPFRLAAIKSTVPRILVSQQPYDCYLPYARACALSDHNLVRMDPAWTAGTIVHEAVHARVHRMGVDGQSSEEIRRIESICVRHQRSFLTKVPNTKHFIEHLDSEIATQWFSEEQREQAVIDRLEALDAPNWLVRWVERRQSARKPCA